MKFTLYSLVTLFILSACQAGRGMPPHPAMSNPPVSHHMSEHKVDSSKKIVNKKDNFPTLTLKRKSLAKDKSLFNSIPIVNKIPSALLPPIDKIPVLKDIKKIFPKGSSKAKSRLHKKKTDTIQTDESVSSGESFSGGSPVNGLDIGMVRLGQSSHYTRLIFDSYKWEGYAQLPVEKVNDSGTYIFTYEPENKRIVGILDGYQAFSALVGDHADLYEGNTMVKTIHIDQYLDKSGFKFTIELKQDAKINVYELHNPARIIIDLAPQNEG